MTRRDDEEHRRLKEAILLCRCPYCDAGPGEKCVTVDGMDPGIHHAGLQHMLRVHKGHKRLLEMGDPMHTSEGIVERGARKHSMPRQAKKKAAKPNANTVVRECVGRLREVLGDFVSLTIDITPNKVAMISKVTRRGYPLYVCPQCRDTGRLDPNDHGGNSFPCHYCGNDAK